MTALYILLAIALVIYIISAIFKAFGWSLRSLSKAIKSFVVRLLPSTRAEKKDKKLQKKARKYAKKHNLSIEEVESQINEILARKEQEIAREKAVKEAKKQEKGLMKIIK